MAMRGLFSEPKPYPGKDPWVVRFEDALLLVQSTSDDRRLTVTRFHDLDDIHDGEETTVWVPDRSSDHGRQLWAPELHEIDGRWYLYYAASDGRNENHRAYVLEADHPLGPYRELGRVCDPAHDVWAIDLTVLQHEGRLYAVWSGWDGPNDGFPQNLYVAPMSNPWTISGDRTLISRPDHDWEMSVAPVNEGPQVLRNPAGRLFLAYSADASWTTAYKMGVLEYVGGDVADPRAWWKLPAPILTAGGHGSFVEIGGRSVCVYHRKSTSDPGWADREVHHAPVRWDRAGYPVIGRRGVDPRTAGRKPGESDQAASPTMGPHVTANAD